ncbi:MAG: hypothetical protein BWX95_01828 [Bacteroidetes bacterium ADurb.Bin141]|nr:MAG: hypothetical protein UZ10_BCD003001236 [Bacteroidetes bacterium OLB10]MBV6454300.1 hypothetical protein [Bacteroidia bacterium]MBX3106008.1 DUF4197 domain-containing protein [Bacteroidota bacterium]OQB61550.1 MAG: hypothetical protein BWX95_01828 [Bacteroidetes bacterium ADurb.Bin141]MCB8929827.1 DUF4197 domain-containing protein [Bacteroidia bacterium]
MKRILLAVLILASIQLPAQSLKNKLSTQSTPNAHLGEGLPNSEIINGLKEALKVGMNNATASASKVDGFYKNPLIKIPFPKEVSEAEKTMRNIGMDKEVDKFVKTLNRAAEDAAKSAAPIFLNSILKMNIDDGLGILRGGNDAATQYLKNTSNAALIAAFQPIVKNSLDKVNITKYWKPLMTNYNKLPFVNKINPDLNSYVTNKAIDGLFKLIASEELKIRKDPAQRINDLLQSVFGK